MRQVMHESLESDLLPSTGVPSPVAPPYGPVLPDYTSIIKSQPFNLRDIILQLEPHDARVSIDIRRSKLVADALKEGRKKKFDPRKNLKVCNCQV